jgi:alpha-amylase/alpha-mannosidase (GH57 family)
LRSENFVCVHGHFYQPPRENPFTGTVDDQPTAAPYRNWNERITAECYTANTAAPVLGEDGEVVEKVNTYEHISFNFGPTLLEWLEENAGDTYRAIIDADRTSAQRHDGHGSAISQAYNHTILPLSNQRDKVTQVRWGIADFEHRFGRRPEGMWLPETAVDSESLAVLAAEGIAFTILSPYQAAAVLGDDGHWADLEPGSIDTRVPYRVDAGEGRSIIVFFYDGPLSQEIAFNGLLEDGHLLADRLIAATGEPNGAPRLAHVATDGETYGHHHKHGEMALAVAIREIEADTGMAMANYSAFLATDPPLRRARIIEDSSWSCAHGVERWRANCGCSTGGHPDWNQEWRAPLRAALDWLRDSIIPEYERRGGELLTDPWAARDAYIEVVLGGSEDEFLDRWAREGVDGADRETAICLIEIQHRAMLMYTSCGWFFDDVAGLEAVLVLRHAGRVIQLTRKTLGIDLEPGFLDRLEKAVSNVDGQTGRDVYTRAVSPHMGSD